jgi:hypothetical protein
MPAPGTSCDSLNRAVDASKQWEGQEDRQHCCLTTLLSGARPASRCAVQCQCDAVSQQLLHDHSCARCCTKCERLQCCNCVPQVSLMCVSACHAIRTLTQSTQRADRALALAQVPAFCTVEVQVPQALWQREAVHDGGGKLMAEHRDTTSLCHSRVGSSKRSSSGWTLTHVTLCRRCATLLPCTRGVHSACTRL